MWTIAICDDEPLQMEHAAQAICRYADDAGLEVQLEQLQDVDECVREAARFDVVFMDIVFENRLAGIDAAARINAAAPNCQIVYLTNYLHYSVDVYHTDHVWYILKEQIARRLPEVFQKLAFVDGARRSSIAVKPVGEVSVVALTCSDICYIERQNRITHIVLRDGTQYDVREKVADLLDKLPNAWFVRCHNSYAVNLGYVKSVHASDLVLEDGTCLPVSRSRLKQFRSRYLLWIEARNV